MKAESKPAVPEAKLKFKISFNGDVFPFIGLNSRIEREKNGTQSFM